MAHASARTRRTILVTGGTGMLGRELVKRLAVAGGATIVVVSRDAQRAAGVLPPTVRVVLGDVRSGGGLGLSESDRTALGPTVTDIVHCAAETTFNRPLDEARATNVDGTRGVVAFAGEWPRHERGAGIRTG
jgi:nucleoside-diphosphate-sugar epimerase